MIAWINPACYGQLQLLVGQSAQLKIRNHSYESKQSLEQVNRELRSHPINIWCNLPAISVIIYGKINEQNYMVKNKSIIIQTNLLAKIALELSVFREYMRKQRFSF